MTRPYHVPFCLLFCAIVLGGCAARKPHLEDLYAKLKEEPHALDTSVLTGKKIVVDPGHGGSFKGAIGADSLREADANLGVALYLWGLCKDAGAEAHLTRTADRDYLPAGSKEPGDDLTMRIAKANELEPDVFISIHHNANIPVKRDVNRIEVYYRASDPGASLELAEKLQVHLARNLGVETAEVRPGNYAVLRLSTAHAAVLGEASYLSHPAVEERLKLSDKQKLEAEAYFIGLVAYFSKGVPTMTRLSPATDSITSPAEISFAVERGAGVPLDPASVRIAIGKSEALALFDPSRSVIRCPMDPGLPNGTYSVQASVRSTGGATARSRPYALLLARPARHIVPLAPQLKPESVVSLSIKVLDDLASPVADRTPVTAMSLKNARIFSGECTKGTFNIEVPSELAGDGFVFATRGLSDTIRFQIPEVQPCVAILATDARTGNAIPAPIAAWGPLESVAGDSKGRILVPARGEGGNILLLANGYRPALIDSNAAAGASGLARVGLEPLFGGVLRGKKLAIDPAGGGADPGGRGRNGLRGASANLNVARRLRDILERAGAEVTLTREGDEPISPQERVYIVNRSDADLAIGIRHEIPPAPIEAQRLILHYPGSGGGALFAERLARSLASLPPGGAFFIMEWASVLLQQTTCPTCETYCGPVEDEAMENAMSDEQWLRLESEKIFTAIAKYFGWDTGIRDTLTVRVTTNGAPAPRVAVDIDQVFVRSTDALGLAAFSSVEVGRHLLTVRSREGRVAVFERDISSNDSGELVLDFH